MTTFVDFGVSDDDMALMYTLLAAQFSSKKKEMIRSLVSFVVGWPMGQRLSFPSPSCLVRNGNNTTENTQHTKKTKLRAKRDDEGG